MIRSRRLISAARRFCLRWKSASKRGVMQAVATRATAAPIPIRYPALSHDADGQRRSVHARSLSGCLGAEVSIPNFENAESSFGRAYLIRLLRKPDGCSECSARPTDERSTNTSPGSERSSSELSERPTSGDSHRLSLPFPMRPPTTSRRMSS